VTTGASQLNLPGDFTVELWFFETNTTPTIPQFVSGTTGGFACGINAFDGNATRKLDWRVRGSAPIYGVTAITTNTWHHAAYVKSGSTFRIFLNGVLEYYNGSYASTFTSTATYIGSQNSGDATYSFRGYISNLRVVKGTAVYTTSSTTIGVTIFTPSTTPLAAITNTALLTCQSTTILDNSINALPITGTGTYGVNRFNPFGYTAQSVTSYTPTIHGGSAYYDGTNDFITSTNSLFAFGASNDFTAECWVYFTTLFASQSPTIISVAAGGSGTGWQIYADSNTGWGVRSNFANVFSVVNPPKTYQWYHVAYVRKSGTHYLFVNGVLNTATSASSHTWSDTSFYSGQGLGNNFYGYVSDVRLINGFGLYTSNFVPPTAPVTSTNNTTLLLNFNNGGIIDQHSSNVLETVGNTQLSTSVKKYNNASIYFDGTGDYLDLPLSQNFSQIGPWTIEMWIYPTAANNCYIYSQVTSNFLQFNLAANMILYIDRSGVGNLLSSSAAISLNTWTHIALVSEGSTVKLYINGSQSGSTASYSTVTASAATTRIGAYQNSGSAGTLPFTGYIDDLRITKGIARYTGTFIPPSSLQTS